MDDGDTLSGRAGYDALTGESSRRFASLLEKCRGNPRLPAPRSDRTAGIKRAAEIDARVGCTKRALLSPTRQPGLRTILFLLYYPTRLGRRQVFGERKGHEPQRPATMGIGVCPIKVARSR